MIEKLNKKLEEIQKGKEELREKMANLEKQRETAIANLNAFVGAESVLRQMIEEETEAAESNTPENINED